jgi:hypothetical protein
MSALVEVLKRLEFDASRTHELLQATHALSSLALYRACSAMMQQIILRLFWHPDLLCSTLESVSAQAHKARSA